MFDAFIVDVIPIIITFKQLVSNLFYDDVDMEFFFDNLVFWTTL